MDSRPRTGKRCENEYRFKKSTNLCHRREQTPSHHSRMYPRTGKRCKRTYRYNKSKKMCLSKLFSPSPLRYESYQRLGKRCKKTYRHHKPSGLCVYTKKRFTPLPLDTDSDVFESPIPQEETVLYSPDEVFESPIPEEDTVLYSPDVEPKKQSDSNLFKTMGIEF